MATYTSNYAWTKPSGNDQVDIGVLNNNLDSQDSIMHDAFLNMAEPFSELSTYAVGKIVLYGTTTYKCHTPVTTPGSWTGSTNWEEYKLSEGGGYVTISYADWQLLTPQQQETGKWDVVGVPGGGGGGGASQKAYGTAVNILTATQANPYVCPSDGVVNIQCNYSTSAYTVLYKIGWTGFMAVVGGHSDNANGAMTVPVLKGDQLYCATSGTNPVANYYPYVDA